VAVSNNKLKPTAFNSHLSEQLHLNVVAVPSLSLLQWASMKTLTKPQNLNSLNVFANIS
jgi:hypothetical protein